MELSKQFSETDYSETESDAETSERRNEREREREKEREKEKSKFGSLKKLTHRAGRSESQENVSQAAATSLDRKYLRFFSRARPKDDSKTVKDLARQGKQSGVPVPTEHYRSYRRVTPDAPPPPAPNKLPKPINYIHASNPNLLDFEKSDFVTKPTIQVPKPKVHKPDNFVGFVTLEEFMLRKQEEERRQASCERAGGAGGGAGGAAGGAGGARDLQRRLDRIVPDVIYGELARHDGLEAAGARGARRGGAARASPATRAESPQSPQSPQTPQTPSTPASNESAGGVSRLRLMFGARRDLQRQESNRSEQYPHLQCPPTFQPETYSLSRPPPPAPARD